MINTVFEFAFFVAACNCTNSFVLKMRQTLLVEVPATVLSVSQEGHSNMGSLEVLFVSNNWYLGRRSAKVSLFGDN